MGKNVWHFAISAAIGTTGAALAVYTAIPAPVIIGATLAVALFGLAGGQDAFADCSI